jgi:hypothetical protein
VAQPSPAEPVTWNKTGRRFIPFIPPAILVVIALSLRLWGITWALPDERHILTYHPDEGVNLFSGVLEGGRARPNIDLQFYNYGGLYFYLWQARSPRTGRMDSFSGPTPRSPRFPQPRHSGR